MTLRDKRVLFTKLVSKLIQQAEILGFECALDQVKRTKQEAAANAASGAGISNSLHLVGLAVDLLLYKDGVYLEKSEDYEPLGIWWEQQNELCCWGGRFKKKDGNHFSVTDGGVK